MRRRQPLPRLWLMTDERSGDLLWDALGRLPRGAGVVFRHHATPPDVRRTLFARVRRIARARGLVLVLAGSARMARAWCADGAHGRRNGRATMLRTAPVHDLRELGAAMRAGVDLVFLSPVFATHSHPGGTTLGPMRFAAIARRSSIPVLALGGMDALRFRRMQPLGACGWAGIDALVPVVRT